MKIKVGAVTLPKEVVTALGVYEINTELLVICQQVSREIWVS